MPVNSTQNTAIHGFDGTTWDKVHINASGHMKCNVENDLTIASMPSIETDISGQYVNISNLPSDPATGSKQDTQTSLLTNIDSNITTCDTGNVSGSVSVSNNTDPATGSKQDTQTTLLSSLDGKITQGADTTLTNAQQVLVYGEVTAGAGTGDLHPIHISQNGDVQVEIAGLESTGQELMSDSLPVVIASDQSTVNVQINDVANQGSENNIANNETITAGSDGTGNADVSDMKNSFLIYEDSSTASYDYVAVLVSGNSGSNYHEVAQLYPFTDSSGTKRVGYLEINLGGLTNIKIKNASSTDTYNNVNCMVYGAP